MKKGKVSENILKRSVIKLIKENSKESAVCGSDCAIFCGYVADEDGDMCVAHAIIRACNNAAAAGMQPKKVSLSITMPENLREIKLKKLMGRAVEVANQVNISITDGHTESLDNIKYPIVSATVLAEGRQWQEANLKPGDSIIMTKWAAMSGAARLAEKYKKELLTRYPEFIVDDAAALSQFYSILPEAAVAVGSGAISMNDCSDGGVFAALWQLADRHGVGLEVGLCDIPIRQESVEVCEFFDINPYKLRSDGSLLIVTREPEALIEKLHDQNIAACVIGKITDGKDRVVISGEEHRFLEEPRQDEGVML